MFFAEPQPALVAVDGRSCSTSHGSPRFRATNDPLLSRIGRNTRTIVRTGGVLNLTRREGAFRLCRSGHPSG